MGDAATMIAIQMSAYGSPDVLSPAEVVRPSPGPHELLIAVHATSINPVDAKIRSGGQRAVIPLRFPHTLGMDVSGTVLEVGTNVRGFRVGDEVFSSPSHRRMGCYAEAVVVRASECAHKPTSIGHEEAAGLPLVGLTAWNALVDAADVREGQRVLIQAGSGGLGSFAVQLAKHLGATVYATCSTRNVEAVRGYGADHVIDYREADFEEVAKGCDVILESIGGEHIDRALRTVRRGGMVAAVTLSLPTYTKRYGAYPGIVMMVAGLLRRMVGAYLFRGVRLRPVTRRPDGVALAKLAALVDEGAIRPVIDRVLPLEDAAEAHRYIESGRARGKIILRVER
ncbi:MAG: NADP-dependent oxidoreductase [Myxococcota bacterium]